MVFETLLLQHVLAPLAHADSCFGEYGTGYIAEDIARNDAHGFGAMIARALEQR